MKFGISQLVQFLVGWAGLYPAIYVAAHMKRVFLPDWTNAALWVLIWFVYLPYVFGWVVWQLLKRRARAVR